MKKYRVNVVYSYWNTFEVEADSREEAESTALDMFDETHMTQGEGECFDTVEITEESK